jgi:hypothetical protein
MVDRTVDTSKPLVDYILEVFTNLEGLTQLKTDSKSSQAKKNTVKVNFDTKASDVVKELKKQLNVV